MAAHEHVGEFIAGVRRQLAQERVIDHQQLSGLELGAQLADIAQFSGVGGEFLVKPPWGSEIARRNAAAKRDARAK